MYTISCIKPIIKYAGGKSRELSQYFKYIPSFTKYYEPFFSGGATFFALAPKQAYVGDVNKKLIDFYQDFVINYDLTKQQLDNISKQYEINQTNNAQNLNANLYYSIRDMFNNKAKSKYTYSTLYYFLNKNAYAGMIRYNKHGEFNVPFGKYVHFNSSLINREQYNLLKNAEIVNNSYEKAFKLATPNDFIFLDPPYDTSFSSYGNSDFSEEQHRKLANDFKNLNAPALMIISSTPLIEELYHGFIQDIYAKNYSVNIRNRFNSQAKHLIIANYNITKIN